ncbi:MAG: glucose/mannose-6-phosphate isomerase [Parcubacteria group bacterium Gr01-1014_38]|nr:MAG: glucose/mannose-6-phosphate isomerase [Parcubacteria group bacterium Gr01-1014_38]
MPHPLDTQDMEGVIRRSPEQFAAGLRAAEGVRLSRGPFSQVILAGMGGSWMAGALVRDAGLSKAPITIHRGYGLPERVPSDTLVLASSFSGNTEETLSAYEAARAAGLSLIGVAAGGELEKRCTSAGVPFVKILADPPTMQPRSATGYGVGILVQILARIGLATADAVSTVERLGRFLAGSMESARQQGEALAAVLTAVTPIIYASDRFAAVAHLWKIKINENAKAPAFWNVFPELNHNEMIGWSFVHGAFHVVLLRDANDHPRVQKRFDITLALLREKGIASTIVPITGTTLPEKVFSSLLVGDWASTALALAHGVDPSPVPMVEDLKKRLKD